LAEANVRVTTAGKILNVGAAPGRHVNAGDSVAALVDCDKRFVVAIFSYRQGQSMKVGTIVRVDGASFGSGIVTAVLPKTSDKIYVVTHVDVLPTEAAAGAKLLHEYAAESRKEKGAVRVEVYVQVSRINHFTLVEVWQNRQALEAHEAAAQTKRFRQQIDPLLGSPYDERLHTMGE